MKKYTTILIAVILFISCIHDFQNPSDPLADDYTVDNRAVLRIVGDTVVHVGDTLLLYGGITANAVDEASLVREYRWDFGGEGKVDSIISHPATMKIIMKNGGLYRCRLVCIDRADFSDTAAVSVHVKAQVVRVVTYTIIVDGNDTITVGLKPDSIARVITEKGDTLLLRATDDRDSLAIISATGDTVRVPSGGDDTIMIVPVSVDTPRVVVAPPYLPDFPNIPGFPDHLEGECAFFAEDSSLMRTTMNFYDVMWEQTRADGLEAIQFVEKLLVDIMGYSIITLAGGEYSYTFSGGVYRFTSDDFSISCAFHYGAEVGSHAEDDTVAANLFAVTSYVSDLAPSLSSPFYTYTKGPLYELLADGVSIDRSLNVAFKIDFTKLKVSFLRRAVHQVTSLPLYVVNDSLQLSVQQELFARMAPVPVREFSDHFHNDSILIDHSGSSMTSQPADLAVRYRFQEESKTATYVFTVAQLQRQQQTAYGDRNGTLKLSGEYATTATLGFNGNDQSIYFTGRYSSSVSDSSWFYCDKEETSEFGTLFFGETTDSAGVFTSTAFGYTFPYVPMRKILSW